MKEFKNDFGKINPYDLSSVAKNKSINTNNISSLRSFDINSAGGKNSTVVKSNDVNKKKV